MPAPCTACRSPGLLRPATSSKEPDLSSMRKFNKLDRHDVCDRHLRAARRFIILHLGAPSYHFHHLSRHFNPFESAWLPEEHNSTAWPCMIFAFELHSNRHPMCARRLSSQAYRPRCLHHDRPGRKWSCGTSQHSTISLQFELSELDFL